MHSKAENSFQHNLEKLNERQLEAVQQTDGPVLVLAGPGTGKTQILASRIAKILHDTDSQAENILCLTYTDAGTVAMRKRLFEFIGTDAYRVEIHTFHSFCNKIIQENQEYFGTLGLEMVSDLEKIAYVRTILDDLPANNPLKKYTGDVYSDSKNLLDLYANMKKEYWTAEYIASQVDAYLIDIQTRDEFVYKRTTKHGKAGELKKEAYNKELERMVRLKAAAQTFDTYQQLMRDHKRYDYDDMILWVIGAFTKSNELLIPEQEKYNYFLVDEYQDTSGSQNKILELLVNYWDQPNVFCVGDEDQSIYRFQGANVDNIHRFISNYTPRVIMLEHNYRSTQYILDAARVLISNNKSSRINNDKILTAKNEEYASLEIKPQLRSYFNSEHEAAGIAKEIEQLISSGVKPNEIAVLYPKHKYAEKISYYLKQKNIPIHTRKSVNLFEEPMVQQIIHLLTYVSAEHSRPHSGEHLLFELLHFDCFRLDSIEIAKLSTEVDFKRRSEKTYSWREALKIKFANHKPDLFSETQPSISLSLISDTIERWIKATYNYTVQQVIEMVINESGIIIKALTHPDKTWYMQVLHTFFDYVKTECSRNSKISLKQLLETLSLMQEVHIELPLQRISYAEDGVQFVTVHSSKGLEFEYVYMIHSTKDAWNKGRKVGFSYPDNLFTINTSEELEERRRLFYVGMTRAKKQLVISYPESGNNDKPLEKAEFVAELEQHADVLKEQTHVSDDDMIDFTLQTLALQPPTASSNLFDNNLVDEILKQYALSVTHLNNYLKCPTAFYFNNLLRIPSPLSPNMTFGSAVHYALERLFKKMNEHEQKQFHGVDQFINDFKFYIQINQEAFTDQELKRRLEYGELILRGYYEKYINSWTTFNVIEKRYRDVFYKNIPLNGALDRIDFNGKKITIVDYKTGNHEYAVKKLVRPNHIKQAALEADGKDVPIEVKWGGDYWRQSVFYHILVTHSPKNDWEVERVVFDFIEPDKKTKMYYSDEVLVTPEDVEEVGKQIEYVFTRIKEKRFDEGCGKEDCNWCAFTAKYYKGKSLNSVKVSGYDEMD